jgi:hypothetical protein
MHLCDKQFICFMKKIFIPLSCTLTAVLLLSSCDKMHGEKTSSPQLSPEETSTLSISIEGVDAEITTRASTSEIGSDKTAQSTQIFIFEPGGACAKKLSAASNDIVLPRGFKYTVAALINGPELANPSLTALRDKIISLKDHPFVMYKEQQADLTTAAEVSVALKVTSLGARVRVKNVTNNLPSWLGNLTINKMFLCNVVGTAQPKAPTYNITYNWYGRNNINTPISDGSVTGSVSSSAEAAAYTLKEPALALSSGESLSGKGYSCSFYCFPNKNKTAIPDTGYSGTTADQSLATWLTVCGTVGAKTYYWTINLGENISKTTGLAANYTYDVTLTINNLGSLNPTVPVVPGSADISCTISPWTDGGDIITSI